MWAYLKGFLLEGIMRRTTVTVCIPAFVVALAMTAQAADAPASATSPQPGSTVAESPNAETLFNVRATLDQLASNPSVELALVLVKRGAQDDIKEGLRQRRTRSLVAWALVRHPRPEVREELEKLVPMQDQVAAYHASHALGALGDTRSVPILAAQLPKNADDYWELAHQTRDGYRGVFHRIRRGQERTIYAEPHHRSLRVTCAAMEALGRIGGDEAKDVLDNALASSQYLVRYGAVRGLAALGAPARRQLERIAKGDSTLLVRSAALRSVHQFDEGDSPPPTSLKDRLAHVPAIAFIKTRHRSDANFGFRDSYFFPKTPWFASGENIYSLTPPRPDGVLRNLTNLDKGAVQGLEVSHDGERLLFSMQKDRQRDSFHICEMRADGSGLRQLTFGACNDVDPAYLGDGRIVFSSDRDGTHEFYHQERVRTLYIAGADGSDLRQLTFNPNQDYEPLALHDGRIVFSSYRFYGQDGSGGVFFPKGGSGIARIESQLRTVLPDGTADSVLYGAQRGGFYVPVRELPDGDQFQAPQLSRNRDHLGVSVSHHRQLTANRLVCTTPAGLTVIDLAAHPLDCELPVYPELINLAGGEEVYIHNHDDLNPIGRYTAPYPIDEQTVLVSHAPFFKRAPHDYGLYLLDLETRKQILVYDETETAEVDVVPLAALPPSRLASGSRAGKKVPTTSRAKSSDKGSGPSGEIVILSVFNSDLEFDRNAVKFLRVSTAEQLGITLNANGGFRSRVIGTVPIEADGSVRITVPANTPLHFQLLDVDERPLVHETAFNNVAPGEVLSCVGCHERKGASPPPSAVPLALGHPPQPALPQLNDLIYMGQPERSYSVMYRK